MLHKGLIAKKQKGTLKVDMIINDIQYEVKKAVIGKDEIIKRVLTTILAKGHVLLEDVPGVGKTTMALAFARTLGLECKRIQFTSDTMPSDVLGFSVYDKQSGKLSYKPGAVMTNLLLADELNRTSGKTQSALLEAMEEGRVTIDGVTHPLPDPFIVIATENPIGSAGTQLLPASQLDRFLFKLSMGYPDRESQIAIMKDRHHANPLDAIKPQANIASLNALIEETESVHVAESIYAYIAELIESTRSHPFIQCGVSPRGALALCRAAKATARIEGRDFVTPDDVCDVFPYVCCHRFILNAKARLRSKDELSIAEELLTACKKPNSREFSLK